MKQYEINGCLALGMKPKEIAEALKVSLGYVYLIQRREAAWKAGLSAILGRAA